MAVRFDASGDSARITSGGFVDGTAAYTVTFWVYAAATDTFRTLCMVGTTGAYHIAAIASGQWTAVSSSGGFTSAGAVSTNTWYRVELKYNGSSTVSVVVDGVSVVSEDAVDISATALIEFGDDLNLSGGAEWFNGRIANAKVFNADLTAAQAEIEHNRYVPSFGPVAWYPFLRHDDLVDYSGNGRTLTAAGTLATEDGPPISWGAPVRVVGKAASGTQYDQSASGTLTTAGTLSRATAKSAAGTLTSAGAIITLAAKSMAGTLTSSGAIIKATAKSFAGTLSTAGALSALRTAFVALAGTLTSAGTLAKQTSKTAAGTLTSAGTLAKAIAKTFAGALSFAGDFASELNAGAQEFLQDVGGTLTTAGTLIKSTTKTFAGTLTSAGSIIRLTAKSFVGTLTSSGALARVRTYLVSVAGTLTSAGVLLRQTNKSAGGTLTPVGTISKTINKTVGGALTFIGTLLASLVGADIRLLDVVLSDAAVTLLALTDSAVYAVTISDSAVYTVTLSDTSRS